MDAPNTPSPEGLESPCQEVGPVDSLARRRLPLAVVQPSPSPPPPIPSPRLSVTGGVGGGWEGSVAVTARQGAVAEDRRDLALRLRSCRGTGSIMMMIPTIPPTVPLHGRDSLRPGGEAAEAGGRARPWRGLIARSAPRASPRPPPAPGRPGPPLPALGNAVGPGALGPEKAPAVPNEFPIPRDPAAALDPGSTIE